MSGLRSQDLGAAGFTCPALSLFLVPRYQLPLNWGLGGGSQEGRLQSPLIRGFWISSSSVQALDRHLFMGVAWGNR